VYDIFTLPSKPVGNQAIKEKLSPFKFFSFFLGMVLGVHFKNNIKFLILNSKVQKFKKVIFYFKLAFSKFLTFR